VSRGRRRKFTPKNFPETTRKNGTWNEKGRGGTTKRKKEKNYSVKLGVQTQGSQRKEKKTRKQLQKKKNYRREIRLGGKKNQERSPKFEKEKRLMNYS